MTFFFDKPFVQTFSDSRLAVTWPLKSVKKLPALDNIIVTIIPDAGIVFNPPQNREIVLDQINDNEIWVVWVIDKPPANSKIVLDLTSSSITEQRTILFKDNNEILIS